MYIIALVISYLVGSIPFGYLIARGVGGLDIRQHGSGNIGATNVTRVIGKKWGVLVFILDFLKGFIVVPLLMLVAKDCPIGIYVLVTFAAVAGHNWTIFLRFKGGKGVSTSAGGICGLCVPFPVLIIPLCAGIVSWILLFYGFKYVSLSSLSAAGIFFVSALFTPLPWEIKGFCFFIFIFIVARHHKNITSLLSQKEHRF
ncbi:MAG: glycerol-3-phosphate 1-O-acyltransferase PlsY [Candidatus Omnitrophica bacterium]|nr:glycerol-3-phosphate 1-O-acyltransferase PlsY [Candidatus Omnitrophota bacterium]